MNRTTILLFGLGAQILLAVVFIVRAVGDIEVDLRSRSENALAARNINWASLDIKGRDLTVTGLAPNDKLRRRALETLGAITGFRRIDDQLSLLVKSPPTGQPRLSADRIVAEIDRERSVFDVNTPYEFRVTREGLMTTISGMAPDTEARDSLIGIARQNFGATRVIDRLKVNPDAPGGFLFAATQALGMAEFVVDGSVGVRGTQIYVTGVAASDQDLERIRSVIDTATPEGFSSSVQLGSRQELESVLRQNPDLAARVGPLPAGDVPERDDRAAPDTRQKHKPPAPAGSAEDIANRAIDRSPAAAARCQARFEQLMAPEKIAFPTGSSEIDRASLALLDNLVAAAKTCPGTRIEIGGHTDDQGSESNNLALSQRRAESVMAFMVRQGVELGRLTAVGYGENQPLVPNRTIVDRAKNRRIDFRIQQSP